jgi:hypothetical protein
MSENASLSQQPILKKRGRKPKSLVTNIKKSEPIDSDKEQIIVHLPISIEDIINNNGNNYDDETDDIFIKSDKDFTKFSVVATVPTLGSQVVNIVNTNKELININEIKENSELREIKNIKDIKDIKEINEFNTKLNSENKLTTFKNINQINVYNINFNIKTKCLWCKHSFDTPSVQLPEDYYNDTFYCTGNFCSWNCMKSYNIDINDSNTWKRESLMHLMYYKTYGTMKEIVNAPSWLLLEDFGGILTINKFRELFIMNTTDYLVLHPPLITRQLQIEESYKKNNNTSSNTFDGELVLKRSKPIETTVSNLEKSMNLRKTKKA